MFIYLIPRHAPTMKEALFCVLLTSAFNTISQGFYKIVIVHPENIYCSQCKTNTVQCIDVFDW
jgi:hypothetical protein